MTLEPGQQAGGEPVFAVVGNVNQGKSSVVATLIEDPAVPIAAHPGTTTRSGSYECTLAGRVVFRLVDTPGFQDARRALAWMTERCASVADRAATVAAFVREHRDDLSFRDEIELLTPILSGCGVLYVVDASARFQPSNEAEMEILRWTGQPGMALINHTRERDFAAEWRPILEQFFNLVREFDAHAATFAERVGLLQGLRELRAEWRTPLDRALEAMRAEWQQRTRSAAAIVGQLMRDALGHVERCPLRMGADEEAPRQQLETAYHERLRKLERDARAAIETLYRHPRLARVEEDLDVLGADLFSEASWQLFGLSRTQLAKYGAAWGAVAGGAIDLMVGGLSFFAGAGLGAGVGALTGWFGSTEVAKICSNQSKLAQTLFPGETGRYLIMGPATGPRFAWVLLDRALLHVTAVRARAHARGDDLDLRRMPGGDAAPGMVQDLPPALRTAIDRALRAFLGEALARQPTSRVREQLDTALADAIEHASGAGHK